MTNPPSKLAVLLKTLLDPDDKVRIQSCKVFDKLEFESIKLWVGEEVLRKGLGERCRDRKVCLVFFLFCFVGGGDRGERREKERERGRGVERERWKGVERE